MKNIDYRSFGSNGPVEPAGATGIVKRWWKARQDDQAEAVTRIVNLLADNDSRRQTQYQLSARLYGNLNLFGVNGLTYSKAATQTQPGLKDRISFNLCQSVVDTITSKIAKNRPSPLFLTSRGNWTIQRRAKKLDQFVEGVFYQNDAYELGTDVFRDATIFGDGYTYVYPWFNQIKFERVMAAELFMDPFEAYYGNPLQLHRVRRIDRDVLIEMFPEQKAKIRDCRPVTVKEAGLVNEISDQIPYLESWRLPSGPEAGDGLHLTSIPNCTLAREEWTHNFFPFARQCWSKRIYGPYGQGLVEQIQPIQLEINKILWIIQRSFHLAGTFKVFLANGSKIVKEHLNNDIGSIINYSGTPPQYMIPQIVPMEMYQHLISLKASGFEQAGISLLSSTAQKPAGLNSGKAIREYNDIETERFMTVGQMYERYHLRLAKLSCMVGKQIYENESKFQVQVPGKRFIETIAWKDVDLEEDQYILKLFPISSLPKDPEGRLAAIQEYAQAGYISPRTARKLSDFPDLDQVEDLQQAMEDYLHMILEKMVDDGIYTPPDPKDDLDLAHELALEYRAQGKLNGLEEEKVALLDQFIDQINAMTSMAQSQAQGIPPGGSPNLQLVPQASPEPPPTSNLIPNAPGMTQ